MSLSNYQFSYNGLTFGATTNYNVAQVKGLEDLPDMGTGDVARPRDVGMLLGLDFPRGRTIEIDLEVFPSTGQTLSQTLDGIRATFNPQMSTLLPLQFQLPGIVAKQVYCRPRKRSLPIDVAYSVTGSGMAAVSLQLVAIDPRIYAVTASTASTPLPTPSSGMTFNAAFNLTFGGTTGSGGLITAVNAGTYTTKPVFTISGGVCTNPRIQLTTSPNSSEVGNQLAFNITMASTDTLVIDTDAHTVTLDGTADRYYTIVNGSQWFDFASGTSTVGFFSGDASPTGATLTATWSSAWL